jgi:hypothetical protein
MDSAFLKYAEREIPFCQIFTVIHHQNVYLMILPYVVYYFKLFNYDRILVNINGICEEYE